MFSMMCSALRFGCLSFIFLAGLNLHAECTDAHVRELHKKGKGAASIARICEMERSDVEDIIGAPDPDPDTPSPIPPQEPPRGGYTCCDAMGNSRCMINNGPYPIGSTCGCWGQGYGVVCR